MNKQKRKGYPIMRRVLRFAVLVVKPVIKPALIVTSVSLNLSISVYFVLTGKGVAEVSLDTKMMLVGFLMLLFFAVECMVVLLARDTIKWVAETWRQAGREG